MTFSPPPRLPWWAWRRRAARMRFLEAVARTEIRLSFNSVDQAARSFEGAYLALVNAPEADVVRGIAWVTLCAVGNDHGDRAEISLRMPLDVTL